MKTSVGIGKARRNCDCALSSVTVAIIIVTTFKKEVQTVSHNYIYISFIVCYAFRVL